MDEISEPAASLRPGWATSPACGDIERLYDAKFVTHSYGDTVAAPGPETAVLPGATESAP